MSTTTTRAATTRDARTRADGRPPKQIHIAAHFPGVNNTTVWSDPGAGSQTDFSSFVHLAQTAERGKFDFFFLAEGLRLREQRGQIFCRSSTSMSSAAPIRSRCSPRSPRSRTASASPRR